MIIEIM